MSTEIVLDSLKQVPMYLSIVHAAQLTRYSVRHIRRIIEIRRIPIIKIGRKLFILGRDLSSLKESKPVGVKK